MSRFCICKRYPDGQTKNTHVISEPDIVRALLRDRVKILSYLDSILGDFHLAEDCFQDLCAAAVAKDDYFEDATHLLRWSLRAGRNKAIDSVRRRSRQPCVLDDEMLEALEEQWLAESSNPSENDSDRVQALKICLDELTDNSRKIVDLRYTEGLKSGRIAELLGRKVEAVYRSLARTHVALRECMNRRLAKEDI